MTRNELIALLMAMPGENPNVSVLDFRKHLGINDQYNQGPEDGIYKTFSVVYRDEAKGKTPYIAIQIDTFYPEEEIYREAT